MSKVIFIGHSLKGYREPIFSKLAMMLAEEGIVFTVLTAEPSVGEELREDNVSAPYVLERPVTRFSVGAKEVFFHHVMRDVYAADVIIATEGQSNLHVPVVMLLSRAFGKKFVLFGHGRNFQAGRKNGFYKRWLNGSADYWLTYTEECKQLLINDGIEASKVSVFMNSIDTSEVQNYPFLPADVTENLASICFLGSLHRQRNVKYLSEVIKTLCLLAPNLQIHVIGSGEAREELNLAIGAMPSVTMWGYVSGAEKFRLLSQQSLLICPEMLGLNVVDSIYSGVPIITKKYAAHSPEADYLTDNIDSIFLENGISASDFGQEVLSLLSNKDRLGELSLNLQKLKAVISGEAMLERLCKSIVEYVHG